MTITSNRQYKHALQRLEAVFQADPGSRGFHELDMLATAIHEWEEKHFYLSLPKVKRSEILARNQRERHPSIIYTLRFDKSTRGFDRRGRQQLFLKYIRRLQLLRHYGYVDVSDDEKDPDTM